MSNGVSNSAAEFKVICKGTYWIVKQKVYLFGFIPFWQRFCWGANELKRYATKAMALIGIAEYIAARDREGKLVTTLLTRFATVFTFHNRPMETADES